MEPAKRCFGCMEEKGDKKTCAKCGWVEGTTAESSLHLPPGTILNNKYLLGKVIGQGGFGITYLAWDITLGLKLAIKEYFPQELASRATGQTQVSVYTGTMYNQYEYGMEKFLEEARMLARFEEHPNIVSVRDYFSANDTAYLVMSYIEGITLKEFLISSGNKLPADQAFGIIMPVMDALKELHSTDVLHRDISPDNIFIKENGQVILIDFGAARQAISTKGKMMSVIIKPGYAPEEQYRSQGVQGPWTDIYSIAATIYHMITGQMPPESLDRLVEDKLVPPSQLGVAIKPEQEWALMKALSVRAKDRYQSIEDFQNVLLAKKPISQKPATEEKIPTADIQWYIKRGKEQFGPYLWDTIIQFVKDGNLLPGDYLKRDDLDEEYRAVDFPGLFKRQGDVKKKITLPHLSRKTMIAIGAGFAALVLLIVSLAVVPGMINDRTEDGQIISDLNLLTANQSSVEAGDPNNYFVRARGSIERSSDWSKYGSYSLKITSTDDTGMTHVSVRDVDIRGLSVGTKHACQVVIYIPQGSGWVGQKVQLRYAYYDEARGETWYPMGAEIILKAGENKLVGITEGIDFDDRTKLWFAFFFELQPYGPIGSIAFIDGIQVELSDQPTKWQIGSKEVVETKNLLTANQSSVEAGDPNEYFVPARGSIERSSDWNKYGSHSLKITSTEDTGTTHVSVRNIDIRGFSVGTKHACQVVIYIPPGSGWVGQKVQLRYAYYDEARGENWRSMGDQFTLRAGENELTGVTEGIDFDDRTKLWFAFFFELQPYGPIGSIAFIDGIQVELSDQPTKWQIGD